MLVKDTALVTINNCDDRGTYNRLDIGRTTHVTTITLSYLNGVIVPPPAAVRWDLSLSPPKLGEWAHIIFFLFLNGVLSLQFSVVGGILFITISSVTPYHHDDALHDRYCVLARATADKVSSLLSLFGETRSTFVCRLYVRLRKIQSTCCWWWWWSLSISGRLSGVIDRIGSVPRN